MRLKMEHRRTLVESQASASTSHDVILDPAMNQVREELMSRLALPGEKGSGKTGKRGPPPPRGKGDRKRNVTPLGRRFHWRGLSAERVQGTVFDGKHDNASAPAVEQVLDFDALQHLF